MLKKIEGNGVVDVGAANELTGLALRASVGEGENGVVGETFGQSERDHGSAGAIGIIGIGAVFITGFNRPEQLLGEGAAGAEEAAHKIGGGILGLNFEVFVGIRESVIDFAEQGRLGKCFIFKA